MAKSNLRLMTPDSEIRTVALRRRGNRDMGRDREHLTELEVERLIKAAKGNRHGHRDATMILIGFRTACGCPSSAACSGHRSSSRPAPSTCAGPRPVRPRRTRSSAMNCGRCGNSGASQPRPSPSPRSGVAPYHLGLRQVARACRRRGQDWLQGPPAHAPACLRVRAG